MTGVDLGLEDPVVTSSGEKVGNPRFLKRAAAGLRREQESLSRKRKGSANRGKARALVAKARERTANARNGYQHRLPGRLVDGEPGGLRRDAERPEHARKQEAGETRRRRGPGADSSGSWNTGPDGQAGIW